MITALIGVCCFGFGWFFLHHTKHPKNKDFRLAKGQTLVINTKTEIDMSGDEFFALKGERGYVIPAICVRLRSNRESALYELKSPLGNGRLILINANAWVKCSADVIVEVSNTQMLAGVGFMLIGCAMVFLSILSFFVQ